MILSFTGHRPDKLGGYDEKVGEQLTWLAIRAVEKQAHRITGIISGMALGWDRAAALAGLSLNIPVTAAVPFLGQELKWPPRAQARHHELLKRCAKVVYVCEPGYSSEKMQRRNEWMVDNSDALVALWNGTPGGTANCVNYAISRKKPWINLWEQWKP